MSGKGNCWDNAVMESFFSRLKVELIYAEQYRSISEANVKYLESRLVELAKSANRYVLLNGNTPQLSSLSRGDRDSMEEFIGNLRTLLGVIGHKALEPVASHEQVKEEKVLIPNPAEANTSQDFTLSHKKLKATAIVNNEGIVVLQGTELSAKINDSLAEGYRKLR